MDTKRGGSFMTEQVLNIVWRRREVQNATVLRIGEVDADLTKSLSSFYEVEKARSRYWEWGVNKKWRRRRTLVISLVFPMVLLGQTGEKSVVSRGHTLKGGVFKKIRQWRDSTITIVWKKKACMEKIAWGIGRDLRTNVQEVTGGDVGYGTGERLPFNWMKNFSILRKDVVRKCLWWRFRKLRKS